jgi:hypothetical protein
MTPYRKHAFKVLFYTQSLTLCDNLDAGKLSQSAPVCYAAKLIIVSPPHFKILGCTHRVLSIYTKSP